MEIPVEWKLKIAFKKITIHFTHDCTIVVYAQLIQTGFVLLLLQLSTVLCFTLYKDTGDGRAVTHQLYSSTLKVLYTPMILVP